RGLIELDELDAVLAILHRHLVAGLQQHARNVAVLAVDLNMAVADELPRAGARRREPESMDHIVQPPFHDAQKRLAGLLRRARGCREITPDLILQNAVEAFQLLFCAEAHAVLAELAAAVVHARRRVAAFDGALGALAASALEEQLHAFPAANLANGIEMAG